MEKKRERLELRVSKILSERIINYRQKSRRIFLLLPGILIFDKYDKKKERKKRLQNFVKNSKWSRGNDDLY